MMHWKDSLSVGVNIIDEQHKELIARINKLLEAMGAGRGSGEINAVVGFLEDYTVKHFKMEEEHMLKFRYEAYTAHLAEHTAFISDVQKLKNELNGAKICSAHTMQVQRRVCDWIVDHIGKTDAKLGAFLKDKA